MEPFSINYKSSVPDARNDSIIIAYPGKETQKMQHPANIGPYNVCLASDLETGNLSDPIGK